MPVFAASPVPPVTMNNRYTVPGTYTFTVPAGVTSITVQTWGGGGRGGSRTTSTDGTGGGGGGGFSQHTFSVTPGQSYVVTVGAGSTSNSTAGGDSWFSLDVAGNAVVLAKGGNSVATNSNTGATGGSAASGIGSIKYSGGNGANRVSSTSSGGGGSSAGTGTNGTNASGTTGGVAPSGGGNGGNGRTSVGSGNAGQYPGGGGGGAVRGSTGSPSGGSGGHGQVNISYSFNVNAGVDQTQCSNALFFVNTTIPPSGYTATWSVVAGTGFIYENTKLSTTVNVPAGQSATIRLTVTNGTITATDDVVLTNTTGCVPVCSEPLNENGDLELSGSISSYNLSFQGTPAALIYQNTNPVGWSEAYGTNTPNTTSFTGAYHIHKTGANGDPNSGSKYIYMAGNGFCLSNLKTGNRLQCGKRYRVSVWIAAYTNGATQGNSPFYLEFFSGGTNMPDHNLAYSAIAPASSSWNNLNWQHYSFEFTVPANGYQWADFVFTTLSNTNGIVIDDVCVQEIYAGSTANAGPDLHGCTGSFVMAANTPEVDHTGSWSVVSGNASVTNATSPTSGVNITSGNAARLRWTVTATGGTTPFMAINPETTGGFENCCTLADNGWTVVNNSTNQWHAGSVSNPTSGGRAAYISNNGGTSFAYTNTTTQTSHFYRDIKVHPEATNITLSFKWKNLGQSGFDRILVYTAPTSITPVAGTPASSSTSLSGATLVSGTNLHSSANYQTATITLPNSLAGTEFRLIFTWQNNSSTGTNPPASIDEISLVYDIPACTSSDEVNIAFPSTGGVNISDEYICPGETVTLTPTGCNAGTLSWSDGSSQPSLTVTPATTTQYHVTCTPSSSSNLFLNAGYESSTNLQNWENWANASITTTASDVYAGSKAVMINTIGQSWGGVAQGISSLPGLRYRIKVNAKTTNTNILPALRYQFYQNSNLIEDGYGPVISTTDYSLYEFEIVSPPGTTWLTIFAEIGGGGQLFLDNWEVVSFSSCQATDSATIHVGEVNNIQNHQFDQSVSNWNLYLQSGNSATASQDNTSQLSGVNSARVNIASSSGTNWHIQLIQEGVRLEAGKFYQLSFSAKAASNRTINAFVDLGQSPWTSYFSQNVSLTSTSQTFTFTFAQAETTSVGRVGFNLGQSSQTVWIDDVIFNEICELPPCPDECTIPSNPDINVVANGVTTWQALVGTNPENITNRIRISGSGTVIVDNQNLLLKSSNAVLVIEDATLIVRGNVGLDAASSKFIMQNGFLMVSGNFEQVSNSVVCISNSTVEVGEEEGGTNFMPGTSSTSSDFQNDGGFRCLENVCLNVTHDFLLQSTGTGVSLNGVDLIKNSCIEVGDRGLQHAYDEDFGDADGDDAGNWQCNNTQRIYNTSITIANGSFQNNLKTMTLSDVKVKVNKSGSFLNNSGTINGQNVCVAVEDAFQNSGTWIATGITWYSELQNTTNVPNAGTESQKNSILTDCFSGCSCDNCDDFIVSISGDTTICLNSSTTLTAVAPPGNNDYLWSTGSNQSSITVNPGVLTNYQLIVSDHAGCVGIADVSVHILPLPTIVTGSQAICQGDTLFVTATATGGTPGYTYSWTGPAGFTSGSQNIERLNALTSMAGLYSVTASDNNGCAGMASQSSVVWTNPAAPVVASVIQPTCDVPTGSVSLTGLPSSGNWLVTRLPGNQQYSGSGTTLTITNLPIETNYQFYVNDFRGCQSLPSAQIYIDSLPPNPVLTGDTGVCINSVGQLLPQSDGTWTSGNPVVASISSNGMVTGNQVGSVTLTYSRASDGCSDSLVFTVHDTPSAPATGDVTHPNCATTTGSVTLSNLPSAGSWTLTRSPGGNPYTGSGTNYTVTGLPANSNFTFTVTDLNQCVSLSSAAVTINPVPANPAISINYLGSACVTDNKQLTVNITGGLPPFTYAWAGPSGFTSTNDTIDITLSGSYQVTVTDANQCTASVSGFVYQQYEPFIVSINSEVCEGEDITLDVSSASAVSFLWSANANNATTRDVTVTPSGPSSIYQVTVTNDLGCTAVPEITIIVHPKPGVTVSGPQEICVGETTTILPNTGGTWVSTYPTVAHITNAGVITGLSEGTATFIFTESVHDCPSDASTPIVVKPKPVVSVTGPTPVCVGDTTYVTPSSGGSWVSSNPLVATVDSLGLVLAIGAGTANFTFTSSTTFCTSNATQNITVQAPPAVTISGVDGVCLGTNTVLTANFAGGTWSSSNPDIATINNSGIITSVDVGEVTIYYHFVSGVCEGVVSKTFTVYEIPVVQFAGPDIVCAGQTTSITPSSGGTWTSSNPSVASINNQGVITALTSGYAAFVFVNDSTGCISETSGTLTVYAKPSIALNGPSNLCLGATTSFLPFTGGTWTSLNPFVATITNSGNVTSVGAGSARFIFTHAATGCVSDTSVYIQVGTTPSAAIDYHGSICIRDNSQLSVIASGGNPPFTYQWVGPLGFTGNTSTISITNNGSYFATVTDSYGCKANVSGYVYQRFDPVIVNLSSSVCEGQSANLSVNASSPTSYLWSVNAGSATTSSVVVNPVLPSSTYQVTVTNTLGCQAVATATVNVNPKPAVQITGPSAICVGQTTNLTPSTGGTWVSLNPSVSSVSNTGLVTATNAGTARFLFTQTSTGCISDTTGIITINPRTTISLTGPSAICIGSQTQLSPTTGGTWTSLSPAVATVTNAGVVTGFSQGIAQFTFTNTFGCPSTGSISVTVNSKPAIVLNGPGQICLNGTTQFLPSTGGTWSSSHPLVATITNSGAVTGISPGSAKFVFTNTSTGCKSDSSVIITVVTGSAVSITGPTTICVGSTTTLSPSTGGTWTSSNPSVASVTNGGVVTGIGAGNASFVFTNTATGCPSLPTTAITVNPRPVVSITGPTGICPGSTTTLSPVSGGTWATSNAAVATVTSGGVVTAVASGLANFTFTNSTTGCLSLPTSNVTVYAIPVVSSASTTICIGSTATVQPSSGGTWQSLNPSVASVNNSGVITGLVPGTVQFVFTDNATGCISNPTAVHTVSTKPTTSITGQTEICQGFTSQLSPTTGGNWISLNPTVASVTSAGVVTGLSNGTATFIFTTNQGCSSDPTGQIVINGKPTVSYTGPPTICVGATTQLSPSVDGTWTSSRPHIATVTSSGLVTGIAAGQARFLYTKTATGCKSDSTAFVTVNALPQVSLLGPATICIGQTSQLTPTAGGTWISLTPTVATVSNSGLVTGVGDGSASFKFIESSTGCETIFNNPITVLARPAATLIGPSSLCIGATTQYSPNSGGTWTSLNPTIASIDNAGIVTALAQGVASFVFTSQATGCASANSTPVTVQARPGTTLNGRSLLCIGDNTQLLPNSGGTWSSGNPAVATISNTGFVTAVSTGTTSFLFTDASTGCTSNSSVNITVLPPATLSVSGTDEICLGFNTTLSSASAGIWYSTRPDVAVTTSNGLVTGTAPGKVSFYFVESSTGCTTYLPQDAVTVLPCIDPDFNVTMVNVPLTGNVHTNDEVPMGTTYPGTVFLVSKPLGSVATITVSSNGTYNFTANMAGTYVYEVMICLPSYGPNCPVSRLSIQVINPNTESHNVVPNLDIMYTLENQSISIPTMENDKCISGTSCSISPAAISILTQPRKGTAVVQPSGNILYTPNAAFAGLDTLRYQVCASNNPSNCRTALQIITVMASNALRAVSAADDFQFLSKGQSASVANVLANDKDSNGGTLTVTPQGSIFSPVTIAAGSYYVTGAGAIHFSPEANFTGPVDIEYQVCNTAGDCVFATAHFLVLENLKLRIRAYLEGALMENQNQRGSDNRPLMRDNLRMSPYTGANYIPATDPYSQPTTYFDISPQYEHVGNASLSQYTTIPNPSSVFAVTGQNAIVDWVFIEVRSKTDNALVLATRSALIQRDGDVVDLDGISPVEVPDVRLDSAFIVLRHRNHFGVMSRVVSTSNLLDFTNPSTPTFDFGTTLNDGYDYTGLAQKADVVSGYMAMWAGDFDSNGRIKFVNPDDDQNILFFEVLSYPANAEFMANYNFSYGYLQGDIDLNSKSKYDNPDDDKNVLFYQVLFHPLNGSFISNFNFIREQVPDPR